MRIGFGTGFDVRRGTAPPAPTYALWAPLVRYTPNADPALGVPVLSNGQLTATGGGSWTGVLADIGKATGSWFFQFTIVVTDNSAAYTQIGVGTATCGLEYAGSGNPYSWGVSSHGYTYDYGAGYVSNGVTFAAGDVVGCSILRGSQQAKFYKLVAGNWSLIHTADISAAGANAVYPYFSGYSGGSATANFGESSFAATVPDSANAGVYTT